MLFAALLFYALGAVIMTALIIELTNQEQAEALGWRFILHAVIWPLHAAYLAWMVGRLLAKSRAFSLAGLRAAWKDIYS